MGRRRTTLLSRKEIRILSRRKPPCVGLPYRRGRKTGAAGSGAIYRRLNLFCQRRPRIASFRKGSSESASSGITFTSANRLRLTQNKSLMNLLPRMTEEGVLGECTSHSRIGSPDGARLEVKAFFFIPMDQCDLLAIGEGPRSSTACLEKKRKKSRVQILCPSNLGELRKGR